MDHRDLVKRFDRQVELHPNLRNSAITTSLVPIVSSILKGQEETADCKPERRHQWVLQVY